MIDARARLLDAGIGRTLLDRVVELGAVRTRRGDRTVVADLGSGSGHLLALISERMPVNAVGIDLSVTAAQRAAMRWPHVTWVVANADRRIPLLDRATDLICSVNARRNPAECARALAPGGCLVVAVPATDDLVELRTHIGGVAPPRHNQDRLLHEHEPHFELLEQQDVRERRRLDRPTLLDLLRATYRGERRSAAARLATLDRLDVTLAGSVFVYRARP